jgi:hypothetical protein
MPRSRFGTERLGLPSPPSPMAIWLLAGSVGELRRGPRAGR